MNKLINKMQSEEDKEWEERREWEILKGIEKKL